MISIFCLRLAFGMIAPLVLLPASIVPPRFFRVQFLVALALVVIAALFLRHAVDTPLGIALGAACFLGMAGSIVWHTDEAPLGRVLFWLFAIVLGVALFWTGQVRQTEMSWLRVADDYVGALLLGGAASAMLMGHSYLIAPAMTMSPLNRLLGCLSLALAVRVVLAGVGLWYWTRERSGHSLEVGLWLGARWVLLLILIGLTWMACETARIRSTQSATGILYVATIVCFLSELLAMLLLENTGVPL